MLKKTSILSDHENVIFILIYRIFPPREFEEYKREFEGMKEVFAVFKNESFSEKTGIFFDIFLFSILINNKI